MSILHLPVKIKLCDFQLLNFDEHRTVSPLLALNQAIVNSSSRRKDMPSKIPFSQRDAVERHIQELNILANKRGYALKAEVSSN